MKNNTVVGEGGVASTNSTEIETSSQSSDLESQLLDLGLFDDWCSYLLLQKMYFPIEVSRINATLKNEFIQSARIKVSSLKSKILQIASLKGFAGGGAKAQETEIRELIGKLKGFQGGISLSKMHINHAREYICLYSKLSPIDVATTFRYNKEQSECCIIARVPIAKGTFVPGLSGTFCPLPLDAVEHLAREKRDFSMMYSSSLGTQGIFVGTARFLNHDCQPNCEFSLSTRQQVRIRTLKDVGIGQELTVFYGKDYFGPGNKECLCESCSFRVQSKDCQDSYLRKRAAATYSNCSKSFICPCADCRIKLAKERLELNKRNIKLFGKNWPLRK